MCSGLNEPGSTTAVRAPRHSLPVPRRNGLNSDPSPETLRSKSSASFTAKTEGRDRARSQASDADNRDVCAAVGSIVVVIERPKHANGRAVNAARPVVAAVQGFEPQLLDSESSVLPLDDTARQVRW